MLPLAGVACVVVSSAERDRGGSSKVAEALYVYLIDTTLIGIIKIAFYILTSSRGGHRI